MAQDDDPNPPSTDAHDPLLVDAPSASHKKLDEVSVAAVVKRRLQEEASKYTPDGPKEHGSPAESSRGPSFSTGADQTSDAGSIRSMPAVRVSESPTVFVHEPESPMPSPSPSAISHRPPPSPSRSQEPTNTLQTNAQRRSRHRSVMLEGRSANRLSGFFNNLIHRREPVAQQSREANPDAASSLTPSRNHSAPTSEVPSRTTSPPPRPATPPPSLPPPTLSELGLSLLTMTSDLSPPHFSAPPTSGAFLAPHYLLLCHAQGLDVLPLVSPPSPQPYALVRRVSFKSVVVMEQRGVLVAIAGRRDGVRVYALEEIKKAIEWRIDVEIKRERERFRRENMKKTPTLRSMDGLDYKDPPESIAKTRLSAPPPSELQIKRTHLLRKSSHGTMPLPSPPPVPLIPRSPVGQTPKQKPRSGSLQLPNTTQGHMPAFHDHPPPYAADSEASNSQVNVRAQPSALSLRARSRSGSVNNVLSGVLRQRSNSRDPESKADWAESSDDEAIDIVAAGASGSQALDERTSATLSANRVSIGLPPVLSQTPLVHTRTRSGTLRRNRPSNLDLSLALPSSIIPPAEPSPAPTLLSIRQALTVSPMEGSGDDVPSHPPTLAEEDEADEADGRISLAQALLESRLPELPPVGTTRPQEPILISSTNPTRSETPPSPDRSRNPPDSPPSTSRRRRRRWSVLLSNNPSEEDATRLQNPPNTAPATDRAPHRFTRSHSFRSNRSQPASINSTIDPPPPPPPPPQGPPASQDEIPVLQVYRPTGTARFLPRFVLAFNGRRSEERATQTQHASDTEVVRPPPVQATTQAPPPKLEYVKLPGTKNALTIKAVETAKKSFLAILCGDNGEKVELFAGTYRTALGLSRTFILPDSPRSLELQLQGDDLVEVFLVFAQNVFGLEPATVRVREVRIGRAERRAARRRARERTGDGPPPVQEGEAAEDDTNVNVTVGVSVSISSNDNASGERLARPSSPALVASEHPSAQSERPASPAEPLPTINIDSEELLAVANPSVGPYTTFQQLSFAPRFPLASIADDYIIPPTYPSFVQYRADHEPEGANNSGAVGDSSAPEFSPPGLPIPTPTTPPQWYYRDPKGVVHGPWKSSLMQAWYKQGLLPPDLPIRRADDDFFSLLKELRLQTLDPTQPFSFPPTLPTPSGPPIETEKPLLSPISLLAQPRHFGPPALFFSSRGGHSTAIVDSRGRSVLKGRFVWTNDDNSEDSKLSSKMGDIKRLEAFDVQDRSVLVAMRQGGLEAVDLRDALLKPADESRTVLPHYSAPVTDINRRPPFVWKIGTPIMASPTPFNALSHKPKSGFGTLAGRKSSVSSGKTVIGRADVNSNDYTPLDSTDEVFFVGRKDDEIYFCERNAGTFRILKLAPEQNTHAHH